MAKPTKNELLTPRQREVLDYIISEIERLQRPPTIRDLGTYLGLSSSNAVVQHLSALERKGFISRAANSSRAIVLTKKARGLPLLNLSDLSEATD